MRCAREAAGWERDRRIVIWSDRASREPELSLQGPALRKEDTTGEGVTSDASVLAGSVVGLSLVSPTVFHREVGGPWM